MLELLGELWLLLLVLCPKRLPLLLLLRALARMGLEDVVHAGGHLELAILPSELVACGLGLLRTQGRTMCIVAVSLVGGAEADDRLHLDQRGLVGASLRLRNRLPNRVHVRVPILHC